MDIIKTQVCDLLRDTKRTGIDRLIEHMEQSGFFEAPCSGQYHLAKTGGLAEHSLNVCYIAHELNATFGTPVYLDNLTIVSLLHDLGKCGQFEKPEYIPNMIKDGKPTKAEPEQKYKQSESKPYEKNKSLLPVDHEVRSIVIASQYIQLTEDEQFAILMHNGLYGPFKYELQGKETPLYMILHFADMWASRVVEHVMEQEVL